MSNKRELLAAARQECAEHEWTRHHEQASGDADHALILHNQGVLNRNLARVFRALIVIGEIMTSEFEQAKQEADAIAADVTALGEGITRLVTSNDRLVAKVDQLEATINAGSQVTPQQITDLRTELTASREALDGMKNAIPAAPAEGSDAEEAEETAEEEAAEQAPPV